MFRTFTSSTTTPHRPPQPMIGKTASLVGGIGLGGIPLTLLTGAATGSLPWVLAAMACTLTGGTVLVAQWLHGGEHTERTIAWTGLVGGGGLAGLSLTEPHVVAAFPGGAVPVWLLAAVMVFSSIPVFQAAARRAARRPVPRLRTIRIVEDRSQEAQAAAQETGSGRGNKRDGRR